MRFLVTVLFGVGVTLTWQSYGEEAKEMARTFARSLGWSLPVSEVKSSADPQASAATGNTVDLLEQLNPLLLNVATLRSNVQQVATAQQQFATKQEQIMQNITTLREIVQQSVRPRMSSPPRARAPLPLSTGQASAPR